MFRPDHYAARVPALAPYAAALRAFHGGDDGAGIRLRSSLGEDEVLPAALFFRGGDDFLPFERYALDLAQGRVLDLGAGTGVHSLELQRRGYDTLAVENCGALVDLMRARGVHHVLRADFTMWCGPRFETVLMLMNGIGPTGTIAGLDRFLWHARRFVTDDGQLIIDSAEAAPECGESDQRWPDRGEYPGQAWIDLEHDGARGRPFRELYADMETLRERATRAGWVADVAFEEDGAFLVRLTPGSVGPSAGRPAVGSAARSAVRPRRR
ncbi:MAG: class I SAM-dependent methyltransferase [Gemmatimonadota bacterium]|nr:class I SAM-dependent methyltransferase [Gemmatimonadota bacterium]